ncbi:hypothetical protein [Curtobacterium aetherium]|uniref:Uncharacterized protein n=1 Tax=Curtobacterium aetherium TaxID=2841594 RepID=A0ACD1E2E3_9MICO|nr:hypothetical protein [Curtobacterium sp. L6-1]QWS32947.1 hypothetical protein KM842_11870 [Curtobacterium sp. L6-1]
MHDRPTIHPHPATPAGRPGAVGDERCPGRFDRWHCGRERGHGGLHAAEEQEGRTTWNDTADGRALADL